MAWLWLLVGFLAGLLIAFVFDWVLRRRRTLAAARREAIDHGALAPDTVAPNSFDDANQMARATERSDRATTPANDVAVEEAVWALRTTQSRLDEARSRLMSVQARLAEAERHAESREAALDDLRDDRAALAAEMDAVVRERDQAETALALTETELDTARRVARDLEQAPSPAALESQELREELSRTVARAAEAGRRSDALERALVSARARAEGAVAELESLQRRHEVTATNAAETASALTEMRLRLEAATTRADELTRRIAGHTQRMADAEATSAAQQARLEELELATTAAERAKDSAIRDSEAARLRTDEVEAAARELREDLANLLQERSTLRETLQEERGELHRVELALAGLVRNAAADRRSAQGDDAARVRIADLEQRLATVEGARRGEIERMSSELERLRRAAVVSNARAERIADLEEALTAERTGRVAAEASTEALMTRATMLEDRLRSAADELQELDGLRERFERVRASFAASRESLAALAGRDAADEIERLRDALRSERERTFRLSARLRDGSTPPDDPEGLRLRIRELEELISRIQVRGPDDLTLVRGIGPTIRDLLASEGITTFAALAAIDEETLARIRASVPVYPDRIERDRWIEQATVLAAGRHPV